MRDYMVPDDEVFDGENRGMKRKILFLCTHNSARSQMAEGLLRGLFGERFEAYSAGIEAAAVDPRAVSVMREIGVDISGQRSKSAEEFGDIIFDLAVSVCGRARAACPICGIDLELSSRAPNRARTDTVRLAASIRSTTGAGTGAKTTRTASSMAAGIA